MQQAICMGLVCGSGLSRALAVSRFDLSEGSLERLSRLLDGNLILPTDAAYEYARRVMSHNPRTNVFPAAIAMCESSSDIQRSLEFAQVNNLPLAVRGGGCDVLGASTCEGGLVIDLGGLDRIDTGRLELGEIRVGSGIRSGALDYELDDKGFAVPLGCDPVVGISGLTLGGGLGWLLGMFGAACDSTTSFKLITADSRELEASKNQNSDLFWALKGGGGNFGVVTEICYEPKRLQNVVVGYTVYSLENAEEFLAAYAALMNAAPRELMVEIVIVNTARGPAMVLISCYSGNEKDAEKAIAPFDSFGSPLASSMRKSSVAHASEAPAELVDSFPPPQLDGDELKASTESSGFSYWKGASLKEISASTARIIVDQVRRAPAGGSVGIGHFMHGAVTEVDPSDSPFPRGAGSMCYYFSSAWYAPGSAGSNMAWVDESLNLLAKPSAEQTYLNYLSDNSQEAVRLSYGSSYPRLREIKRKFDPGNIFRNNRNILPVA